MKKLKAFVESNAFQNTILIIIFLNSIIMGLQTSKDITNSIGDVLDILDNICLSIFVIELCLKLAVYKLRFFLSGWNIFDFIIVIVSMISGLSFMSVFRVFRIFRVFRSLKALKGLRALRLVSGLDHLRIIVEAIVKSIPGILWSGVLLILIYYIFAIIGTTMFGEQFPDWFGNIGDSMYTLFQVMTLESWSMGISRPVMEVFSWAWIYFVPYVLITAFLVMNVVVGIVVNAISEVSGIDNTAENEQPATDKEVLKAELASLKEQMAKVENLIEKL